MNAVMARRLGLDWMVATDHGGPNHSKVSHDHSYPELLESRITGTSENAFGIAIKFTAFCFFQNESLSSVEVAEG